MIVRCLREATKYIQQVSSPEVGWVEGAWGVVQVTVKDSREGRRDKTMEVPWENVLAQITLPGRKDVSIGAFYNKFIQQKATGVCATKIRVMVFEDNSI